jgi:hypothetical protein
MPDLIGFQATLGQGTLTPPIYGSAAVALTTAYSSSSFGGGRSTLTYTGPYLFFANGHRSDEVFGVDVELSGYLFSAMGGGYARGTLPKATVAAIGLNDVIARASLVVSGCTLNSAGTTDAIGRVEVQYGGKYAVAAYGGANAALVLSGYTAEGTGTLGRSGRFTGTMPLPTLTATGYSDNIGSVVGTLPTLVVGGAGVVIGTLPRATISITGGTVSVEYEAYCFALIDGERTGMQAFATHYTTFPFDRIVRFGDKHYGVAADGLYELGTDDFNGVPIVSVFKTHPTDFKARELKRPVSLYFGGRVGADFRVSVIDSETDANAYNYRPVDKTGARNYRVLFGKGIRARYLAYAFTNTNGGDFKLDDVTPEVVVLRRTA